MTLADMFNAPTEMEFEGVTYQLRPPSQLEQGMFQRWLEQRAADAIARREYQDDDERREDRNALNRDIAAGVYEWGAEVCVLALRKKDAIAKLLSIICRDQGLTEVAARRMLDRHQAEIAAVLAAREATDPKEVAAILVGLGLPPDFLSANSSSPSPTPPSESPSANSPDSPTTSS